MVRASTRSSLSLSLSLCVTDHTPLPFLTALPAASTSRPSPALCPRTTAISLRAPVRPQPASASTLQYSGPSRATSQDLAIPVMPSAAVCEHSVLLSATECSTYRCDAGVCRPACAPSICGNGVVEPSEDCDWASTPYNPCWCYTISSFHSITSTRFSCSLFLLLRSNTSCRFLEAGTICNISDAVNAAAVANSSQSFCYVAACSVEGLCLAAFDNTIEGCVASGTPFITEGRRDAVVSECRYSTGRGTGTDTGSGNGSAWAIRSLTCCRFGQLTDCHNLLDSGSGPRCARRGHRRLPLVAQTPNKAREGTASFVLLACALFGVWQLIHCRRPGCRSSWTQAPSPSLTTRRSKRMTWPSRIRPSLQEIRESGDYSLFFDL